MDRDLNQAEFRRFHDLILRLTGIHYHEDKLALLGNRLRRRMRPLGLQDFGTYLQHILRDDHGDERQRFLDSITTNETYLFRCKRHWDLFTDWVRARAADGTRTLRIWSAAASNGAEACTILIVLERVLGRDFGGRSVEVLGTDLNHAVLVEAKDSIFRPYALAQTPPDIIRSHFEKLDDERYRFDRRLLAHATFRPHNLMAPMPGPPFDFVFLRNVMIYFDRSSKERVLGHVHSALRPGGMLLVGESESLLNVAHPFTYLRPSYFQKPTDQPAEPVAKAPPSLRPARG